MSKPIYIGQSVLDISKTLMYEFYYNYLKPKHGDKIIFNIFKKIISFYIKNKTISIHVT